MRTAFPTIKSIEFSSSIFFRELEIEHSQICHRSVRAVTDPSGLRYVVPSMNDIDTLPEVSSANDRPARPNVGNGSAAGDAESVHQPHVDIARRVAPEMSAFPSPLKCGANESHIITAARYRTRPSCNKVAECPTRGVVILPAGTKDWACRSVIASASRIKGKQN